MSEKPDTVQDEIEVTPEMIEAGADVLCSNTSDLADGWILPTELSKSVFLAMEAARRSSRTRQKK